MSGALNSVFGNGGIFGAVLNIASMFFPPLQILNGLSNMLVDALGSAIKGAVDNAMKEMGMPKFMRDLVNKVVDQVIPGQKKETSEGAQNAVKDKFQNAVDAWTKELTAELTDAMRKYKKETEEGGGKAQGGNGAGGAGGAGGGGGKSWYVALMMALGEVMNKQAEKLQKLQKEVSQALASGDESGGSKAAQFEKMEEFKAESQLMNVLTNMVQEIGKALGQALTTNARGYTQ